MTTATVRIIKADQLAPGMVVKMDPTSQATFDVAEIDKSQYSPVMLLTLIQDGDFFEARLQKTDPVHVVTV